MDLGKRPLGLILIVLYKAVWGVLEVTAAGFVTRAPLLRAELVDDPQDQLASWVLAHLPMQPAQLRFVSIGLLALGLLKLVLALGVWYRSWLVRDVALVVMGVAGIFAVGALAVHVSAFRAVVVATDLLIVTYLWRYLPRHLPERPRRALRDAGAAVVP
jgi:uncharacterized membrane protein (DUF2068 family)